MQELINALSNPGSMTSSQWLVLVIGLFIVLGSLYFVLKLLKLILGIGKSTYTPNIGLSKHPYKGQPVTPGSTDEAESPPEPENQEDSKAE
tara:strand:+ start:360 stop:632 length:273 start_codon:yes stop_codon:yes gene_type:complete